MTRFPWARHLERLFGAWLAAFSSLVLAPQASAEPVVTPSRDYFLDAPRAGNFAHLDGFALGAQASYEYRAHLEEDTSMLRARLSGLAGFPYAEASADLEARLMFVTLGANLGRRWVYRNFSFAKGADRSAERRNQLENQGLSTAQDFAFHEARLGLHVPLDPLFLHGSLSLRNEERHDNSFDWLHGNVHDGGAFTKLDAILFFRHETLGAAGPYLRYMHLLRTDTEGRSRREAELAYGFVLGTRPGFVRPTRGNVDLFLFQALFRFGDDEFGIHEYRRVIDVPLHLLALYRVSVML